MGTASPVETGQTLGRYTLIEKLGEGHLGPVWRGLDEGEGRAVVIRILCDGIKWVPEIEAAFQRECRALTTLRHPNVAATFETGRDHESPFIVMESLGRRNLETMIAQKTPLTVETKLAFMIQAAEGLQYAHRNGILHCNLEPSKIHVMADGTVKIRDFALAHVLKKHIPRPAVRWGTPIYLAPEQIENVPPDERSDIFALGTIFYQFLTGQHPFHDPNGNKALDNVLEPPQLPTFEKFPELPPGTWAILKTCLALAPGDRYQNMQDVADACRDLQTSLAEDTRLMLAELYAALPSLRRAAAQPGAPQSILHLHEAVQRLAREEKEAHYARLDALMTRLIEQYPALHSDDAAGGLESAAGFDAIPNFVEPEDPAPEAAEPIDLQPADIPPQPAVAPRVMESIPETPEPLAPEPLAPVPAEPAPVKLPEPGAAGPAEPTPEPVRTSLPPDRSAACRKRSPPGRTRRPWTRLTKPFPPMAAPGARRFGSLHSCSSWRSSSPPGKRGHISSWKTRGPRPRLKFPPRPPSSRPPPPHYNRPVRIRRRGTPRIRRHPKPRGSQRRSPR